MNSGFPTSFPKRGRLSQSGTASWQISVSFTNKCLKPVNHVAVWSAEPLFCYSGHDEDGQVQPEDVLLWGVSLKRAVFGESRYGKQLIPHKVGG